MLRPLTVQPPAGFVEDEVVTTWRLPAAPTPLKDGRVMQFHVAVRPNLVAIQRRIPVGTALGDLVAQTTADLARHVDGLKSVETTHFQFKDGAAGMLLRYTMPVHQKFAVHQLQAMRVDGDVCTTLTLSTEASRLDQATLEEYLGCIAAASVTGPEGVSR